MILFHKNVRAHGGGKAVCLGFRLCILESEEVLRSNSRYGKRATGHFYFDWDFEETVMTAFGAAAGAV